MINYIIQAVLFQAIFLAVYDLFLQKETFFKWNRAYLLGTPILAFIIPLLKFRSVQETLPQEYLVQLPVVFLNPGEVIIQATTNTSTISYLETLFYVGLVFFASVFLIRISKILKLIFANEIINKEFYKLVIIKSKQSAFSFFNYIFINKKLIEEEELEIINHELIHCKQKHSLDLLFFEFLKIVMWFNPLVYIFQNRITLLHEYISDAEIVKETDKISYFNKLLSVTFNVENITFINQFYKHSLIKKRIAMIIKNKSQKVNQLKYLLVVPLLMGMLLFSSFEKDTLELENEIPLMLNESFIGDFSTSKIKETQKVVLKKNDTVLPNDVPFAIIEEVPVFPGCEGTKEELRKCLQEKITMHVSTNFNSTMAKSLGLTPGVKRIFVVFKIDNEGNIMDVRARAPHEVLQAEAIRVVQSIPKMKPGKQRGVAVGVKYSLPIAFKVEGNKLKQPTEVGEVRKEKYRNFKTSSNNNSNVNSKEEVIEVSIDSQTDVPFAIIENVPVFPGCENGSETDKRKCLQNAITSHVNKNFNANLANELNLPAGLQKIFVVFKINKEGNITDVKTRASHVKLEEETLRVVNSIPQMKPGKQRGENVSVKYSLPIAFKIDAKSED
jgi:hypothetical protein